MKKQGLPLAVLILTFFFGCVTTISTKETGGVKPRYFTDEYAVVFFKAVKAAKELGWRIRSEDFTAGKIIGETIYGGGRKSRYITIELTELTGKVRVDVSMKAVNPDTKFYFTRQINQYLNLLDSMTKPEQPG